MQRDIDDILCTCLSGTQEKNHMSFRQDNVRRQTEFRLAVLENGYTPLPNHDKRCFVKGWNTLEPTPELIATWERKLVYQATGLRVENGLCAIDIDIDDGDLVERIWDRAAGAFPQLREALIRYGKGAKELWLCRTTEPFSVIFSTSHVRPGEDPEDGDVVAHRLEAFGGGHPRQIGAYGAHTMKKNGTGFIVEYVWEDDETPADVRLDALPALSKADVLKIADIAREELENAGWPRVLRSRSGETDTSTVYDLTDDMRFDCLDGLTRSLADLEYYAKTRNPRCSASWMGDPQFVNRTRCLIGLDHEGVVSVLETANWTRHMPATLADRGKSLGDKMSDLQSKMEDAGFEFDFDTYHDAPASFQDKVMEMLENWAWCGARSQQCLPVYRAEEHGMTLQNLRLTNLQYAYEREGPRGGIVKISPVDAWVGHSQRQDVDGYRFMPDRAPGIYSVPGEGDTRAINSYRPVVHERVEDGAERASHERLWLDFIEHLIPGEDERTWFLDWLAYKAQNLTSPGVGVIMYAGVFGVGRGSLFEIIGAVFGDRYVNSVTAELLMGTGSQSQYTDWMADTLFVVADEVLPDGDEGTSMAWRRKKAYERLKERIDPKPRRMKIVRKGLPNYDDWVYASFLMATNHENAIPIPKGDRRLVVITNRHLPLIQAPDLYARLNEIRNPEMNPRFVSTIHDWLTDRDVSHFNPHIAPDFTGKAKMQEANITELENIVDGVLDDMPYDWATLGVILSRVENALLREDIRDDFPQWRKTATDRIKVTWQYYKRSYVGTRKSKQQIVSRTHEAGLHFDDLSVSERADQLADMSRLEATASARMRALRTGLREA